MLLRHKNRLKFFFLVNHSYFKIDEQSDVGPCGSSVWLDSGQLSYGWFLWTKLEPHDLRFLDMGGASTQIVFEPSVESQFKTKNLIDVRLRRLGGEEIHHKVFVTTWLGYGTNQARERYVGKIITKNDASLHRDEDEDHLSLSSKGS
jgi:Golgi apyrase